jgi:Tfp pilus assembly protein PilV
MDKPLISRNSLRDESGLSLLETLIAIIILALTLASISFFFSQARVNIEASGRMRCGLALAQDKLEQLKDLPYSHPDLGEGTLWDRVDAKGDVATDGEFYREWTVSPVDDSADGAGDSDYRLVILRVYDQRLATGGDMTDPNKLVAELQTFISP